MGSSVSKQPAIITPATRDENKENYAQVEVKNNRWGRWGVYGVIHFIAFLFAIYLSFKCNGKFQIGSFLVAFFCPWIYIIWILATRRGFCFDYVDGKPPVKIDV